MGLRESKTPLERAESFASSERFRNLVAQAHQRGARLSLNGTKTRWEMETATSVSVQETDWRWDTDNAEDFVFQCLVARLNMI